ncbi:MAG: hypothetical protein RLZ04_632 [Actinomycetota bacterium]
MNLGDLRYLVAVADHRHFGRAAEACFVSQPTLSTQIKKLERELGVDLFERHPRQVLLTSAGERILEHARSVLAETDTIRDVARRARNPEGGTLRIGVFPTLGPYLLPHIVPVVHERFPDLELLLVEEKTEVILRMLAEGKLDVGVLAQPVGLPPLDELPMFEEEFLLAVPVDHPLAATTSDLADLTVLEGETVLLLADGHCLRDQALSVCQLAGASERAGFRATSLETLRQMVAAGVGITLLPALSVHAPVPEYAGIRLLRFSSPPPSRRIALYSRSTSAYRGFLPEIAQLVRDTSASLGLTPLA